VSGRVRLGLIGTGLAVEQLHWPALRQLADRYVVTAFTDTSPAQAARFAGYSGADPGGQCGDYRELLDRADVDAVLICVPIPYLYQLAVDALAAGKHVLCEKPTGTDEQQARAFLELPDQYPKQTFLVGENYFYRDDVRYGRSLVESGAIGRPHLMSWRYAGQLVPLAGEFTGTPWRHRPAYRGGVQLDAGIHNVAQMRMLCGDVQSLHASVQRANTTIDSPSDLTMNLVFASGVVGNYTACYPEIPIPAEPNDMRVYGTEGVLALSGSPAARRVSLYRPDGTDEITVFEGIDYGYYGELSNFADAIQHGEPVVGTVRQTFANMMIVLRALDSAESGAAQPMDGLDAPGLALWRPRGGTGLFDGMPGRRTTHTEQNPRPEPGNP
jgi:predicted dehydrogenase